MGTDFRPRPGGLGLRFTVGCGISLAPPRELEHSFEPASSYVHVDMHTVCG